MDDRAASQESLLEQGQQELMSYVSLSLCGLHLQYKRSQTKLWIVSGVALLTLLSILITSILLWKPKPPIARNVILMISDGFGPASETFARNVAQYTNRSNTLSLDSILIGSSRTRSGSSFVTDSAAGATAFACGIKTYNGGISVDMKSRPCGTVLEAAKMKGLLTGLVATSRISHATPATFAAHVGLRDDEAEIALQLVGNHTLGRVTDLLLGGGKWYI
jgi:alkaline phosphatase